MENMPKEFYGEYTKSCGYTKTSPRKWTKGEIEWCKQQVQNGNSISEIAKKIGRSEVSLQIKLKRTQKDKTCRTYNQKHILEKYNINNNFYNYIKPDSILDLYCGTEKFYNRYDSEVFTNDIDKEIEATENLDALKCLCKLYIENRKFDLVDLDPFGSAYECFDLAIKLANKGIVITLGEIGHKRWKRLDFVKPRYDINDMQEFTMEKMINQIINIGKQNKKNLIVYEKKEWQNIGRVWFEIKPLKITEQWIKGEQGK